MTRNPKALGVAAAVAVPAGLAAALWAPPDALQGDLQRLMYVHVPAAWLAYAGFGITALASAGWLWRRDRRWDRLAEASAELGVFFTGLTIVLGSIWGKPVWGVWWTWDPRLVTTALMFFVYLGYLALRRATPDPVARARRSAAYGLVAAIQLPIVHLSVIWWRSLHQPPTVLRPGDPTIDHRMLAALLINLAAFTLVYMYLLLGRIRLAAVEERVRGQPHPTAGTAVTAPQVRGAADDG